MGLRRPRSAPAELLAGLGEGAAAVVVHQNDLALSLRKPRDCQLNALSKTTLVDGFVEIDLWVVVAGA